MSHTLFDDLPASAGERVPLAEGAVLLRAFASDAAAILMISLREIAAAAPFRHMLTPGGFRMSVAMTNCGRFGWISDESGYRYDAVDPITNSPWPAVPDSFLRTATDAAAAAGFPRFHPNACLINRYEPGARLTMHQDKNERDLNAPIVSVSLGLPAVFLFGGLSRKERPRRLLLESGDVAVWGGPARLAYHGIAPLPAGDHPLTGPFRFNLTFRKL
jgi:alkylated DNA repair protein (DNA oxidative demethylase)